LSHEYATKSNVTIFNLGGGEIIVLLAIVLILFGARKLPELAKGLGQGIREFKHAIDSASAGMRDGIEETQARPMPARRLPQETKSLIPNREA
jgi:sec-independent protein translocase protein TatA